MDFKDKIVDLLVAQTALPKEQIISLLTIPPIGLGDYAFPCFIVAKNLKKNPIEVSVELASKISAPFIEKVESKGPYLNIFLAKSALSESVLEGIFVGSAFEVKLGSGKVMVEYSSPNTNKPLHVGHLRNNILGSAIANLLKTTGHNVIKTNLINDRGVHICKSMLAYKLYGDNKDPAKEGIKSDHFVGDMYVKFSEEAKKDLTLEDKAQEMLVLWEKGDRETIELWKKMNKWAIDGMKQTYTDFGTTFDDWFLESELFKKGDGKKIIQEGMDKGIFKKEDNGAIVAVLEPELPNKVLLRGDGTSLYATNDLALTQYKFDEFKLDKSIWVVANEQDLYFKQLFSIFNKLERKWAKNCFHLSYGYVSLPSGKMKSREGTVVDADELLTEVKELAFNEIKSRYPELSEEKQQKRAHAIALAGIKFLLLKNDAKKDMVFDKQQALAFDGETGPYIQYSFARAKSILRKAESEKIDLNKLNKANFSLLSHEKEKALIVELEKYSDTIKRSWDELSLHPLCHLLLSIAEKFNTFYHEVPVLKATNKEEVLARLALVEATTKVLEQGLTLLDIEAINEM
ncbi:MAG: arginine--tRNA ligase [archaeon]|jgi:arginyl-tRNA synthetase